MDLLQARRNNCLQLVRVSNREINTIRHSEGESQAHIDEKRKICDELLKKGKSFVTEAIFASGGRADILVLDDFLAIEIVKSEKEASLALKRQKYPKNIKISVKYINDL